MPGTEMSESKGVLDYGLQYLDEVVNHCCENMNHLTIMSQIKGSQLCMATTVGMFWSL